MVDKGIFLVLLYFIFISRFVCLSQKIDSFQYKEGYLYYHIYGNGSPIIILAGGPGNNCNQLTELAIALEKYGKCILFEQRGTGLSKPKLFDSTTISIDFAINDIANLIRKLVLC